jgi:hypothetical protein
MAQPAEQRGWTPEKAGLNPGNRHALGARVCIAGAGQRISPIRGPDRLFRQATTWISVEWMVVPLVTVASRTSLAVVPLAL